MHIIVGLGNPGTQYDNTRHNVGFVVVDALDEKLSGSWKLNKRSNAEISKLRLDKNELTLVKPQTFMNLSGQSVQSLTKNLQVTTDDLQLLVIHDDVDLELGTIRVSFNSSSGGHNGVQSIIDQLGTKEFWRVRVGIKPTEMPMGDTADFVLKKFSKDERVKLPRIIDRACELIEKIILSGPKVETVHVI